MTLDFALCMHDKFLVEQSFVKTIFFLVLVFVFALKFSLFVTISGG